MATSIFELFGSIIVDNKDADSKLTNTDKKANNVAKTLGKGVAAAAKFGAALVTATTAAVAGVTKMAKSSAEAMDDIDKASQKMNISAEGYQEWSHAMDLSGMSIDTMKTGMKALQKAMTGVDEEGNATAEEFEKLGISLTNADGSMRSAEDVMNDTIYALADMGDSVERTAIATKLFGKAGTEMAPMLNQGSKAIEGMKQEAHDLGLVMSDEAVKSGAAYMDSLTRLEGVVTGLKNKLSSELLPALTNVTDGFTGLLLGEEGAEDKLAEGIKAFADKLLDALPKIIKTVLKIVDSVAKAVAEHLPGIVKKVVEMLPDLADSLIPLIEGTINAIVDNVDVIVDGLVKIVVMIVNNLPKLIKPLVKAIPKLIKSLISAILNNLPVIISGLVELVQGIVQELPAIILELINYLPEILEMIVKALIENIPILVQGAITLVVELVKHLPEIIAGLIQAIPKILSSIFEAFGPLGEMLGGLFSGIFDTVCDIFGGIADFVGGVFEAIGNIAEGIVEGIKGFFQGAWNVISGIFDTIKGIVKTLFGWIGDLIDKTKEVSGTVAKLDETTGGGALAGGAGAAAAKTKTKMARGGILEKGQTGFLEGNGAEAVVPLENNYKWIHAVAQDMKSALGGGTVNHTGTITIKGVNNQGEFIGSADYVIDQLLSGLRQDARLSYG